MKQRFNWMLWTGLVLAVLGFLSYFAFFSRFPVTRDVPWVNGIFLLLAAALLITGDWAYKLKLWNRNVAVDDDVIKAVAANHRKNPIA